MAKGNNGNYLQHCIEIEAAVRLLKASADGCLHVALTHGMEPFEELEERKAKFKTDILYEALAESAGEPQRDEREIVRAYRKCRASPQHYPNSAELLRTVVGTGGLSGGITEMDLTKHESLKKAWRGTRIRAINSSWRAQVGRDGVLDCPSNLESPWLFSMDPMTFSESGKREDNLNRSDDLDLLECTLAGYLSSGQPGIACLFVYSMKRKLQPQFQNFVEDLAGRVKALSGGFRLHHIGGNDNLAGLLFSHPELRSEFKPPNIDSCWGLETPNSHSVGEELLPNVSHMETATYNWSSWKAFPDPRKAEYLHAPFGPGVYELRNTRTCEFVLFGKSKNVAYRMSSLLPPPYGAPGRNNKEKQNYVSDHLADIEYRTKACGSEALAAQEERDLRIAHSSRFRT